MRFSRMLLGRLLQGLGLVLYAIGALVAFGLLLSVRKVYRLSELDHPWLIALLLLALFVAALAILFLGQPTFLFGKRMVSRQRTLHPSSVFALDHRPVLYLRSFGDEAVTSEAPVALELQGGTLKLLSLTTEEEHLAKALEGLGPFLAIANPRDGLPQLGALRVQAGPSDWQKKVLHLMRRANLLVFRLGRGGWLWWEIEQAVAKVSPQRLLFLIPDDPEVFAQFRHRLGEILGQELPDLRYFRADSVSVVAILFFDSHGTPRLVPLQDAKFRWSRSQPLRPMLRLALRPVFDELGTSWTPPPISGIAYLQVLPYLWVLGLCTYWLVELFPTVLDFRLGLLWFLFAALVAFLVFGILKSGIYLWRSGSVLIGGLLQLRPGSWPESQLLADSGTVALLERTHEVWASGGLSTLASHYAEEARLSRAKFVGLHLPSYGGALEILAKAFPPQDGEYLIGLGETDEGGRTTRGRGWFVLTQRRLIQRDGRDGEFHEVPLVEIERFEASRFWWRGALVLHLETGDEVRFERVRIWPKDEVLRWAIEISKEELASRPEGDHDLPQARRR